jgi:protein-tyrosine phosphatase
VAMEIGQILETLFVGSCPENAADIKMLSRQLGITAVLNLQTDHDIQLKNLDWPALQNTYRRLGIDLHRFPVRDFDFEELTEKLPECARALRDLLHDGKTVYVHCSMGLNRSPTVIIAYLHWYRMWSLEHAVEEVRQCKHCEPAPEAIRRAAKPADSPRTQMNKPRITRI